MSMKEGDALVPVEAYRDHRLTLIQLRVLIAMYSFYNPRNGNLVWPKRATLANRCGYSEKTISTATTGLVKLGWLQKDGKGGFSKAVVYTITVPESETVVTVPSSGTVDATTVPDPGTITVPDPGTRKEQSKEQIKRSIGEKRKKFVPPSLEDVKKYAKQRGQRESFAVRFFEYYEAADDQADKWKDAQGKKIVNWKQKLISWEKRSNETGIRHSWAGKPRAEPLGQVDFDDESWAESAFR